MLLIVAAIPDDVVLADLHELAVGLGLAVLVETHDQAELERALSIGAQIVGVNARDLGTFDEDLGVGERLAALVPPEVIAIAESAIRSRDDAARMASSGFDARPRRRAAGEGGRPDRNAARAHVARARRALS